MTNAEFIVRLRKAKDIAMKLYPYGGCVYDACAIAFDFHFDWDSSCAFVWPDGKLSNSFFWVSDHCKSPADIALVFDNSIADRQREIGEGKP